MTPATQRTPESEWFEKNQERPEGTPPIPPPPTVLAHWACASLRVSTAPAISTLANKAYRAGYQESNRNEHLRELRRHLQGALNVVDGILEGSL